MWQHQCEPKVILNVYRSKPSDHYCTNGSEYYLFQISDWHIKKQVCLQKRFQNWRRPIKSGLKRKLKELQSKASLEEATSGVRATLAIAICGSRTIALSRAKEITKVRRQIPKLCSRACRFRFASERISMFAFMVNTSRILLLDFPPFDAKKLNLSIIIWLQQRHPQKNAKYIYVHFKTGFCAEMYLF